MVLHLVIELSAKTRNNGWFPFLIECFWVYFSNRDVFSWFLIQICINISVNLLDERYPTSPRPCFFLSCARCGDSGHFLCNRYHRLSVRSKFVPMTVSQQDIVQQMSSQLHLVSEIAESLTLRLLSLEERVNDISARLDSAASEHVDVTESFSLLSDSSDRLVQLRGLLNERVEVAAPDSAPRLEVVIDPVPDIDTIETESDEPFLEQTVYVNDSQEPASGLGDSELDDSEDLLSA